MNETLQKIGKTDWIEVKARNNAVHKKRYVNRTLK